MKSITVLDSLRQALAPLAEKAMDRPSPALIVCAYSFLAGLTSWFVEALPVLCMLAGFVGAVISATLSYTRRRREVQEMKIALDRSEVEMKIALNRSAITEIELNKARSDEEQSKIKLREVREELRDMGVETRKGDKA